MPRAGLDPRIVRKAAADIADEFGLDALTLAALAGKLGIRTPSLYNHVNGLPELRRQLTVYGMTKLGAAMEHAMRDLAGDDAVRAMARAYVAFVRQHPGLYEATHRRPALNDPEVGEAAGIVVALVLRVFEDYGLHGAAAIHAVRGFRSVLHGFASIEQQGGFGMPLDLDESLEQVIETFLAGIRARSGL